MNLTLDLPARFVPILARREQLIVWGLDVANVCGDGKAHRLFGEILRGSGAPDPPAVLEAGVLGDRVLRSGRTAWKQLTHALRKTLDVLSVEIRTPLGLALAMTRTRITVGQALCFGPRQSRLLDQDTLSLVMMAGATPLDDDSGQRRVLAGPARQRGVPGGQEDEVIEVSAGQAQGASFPDERDPCVASQLLSTVGASGFTGRDEYFQVLCFRHGRTDDVDLGGGPAPSPWAVAGALLRPRLRMWPRKAISRRPGFGDGLSRESPMWSIPASAGRLSGSPGRRLPRPGLPWI
jgi:hypothetical protein